MLLKVIDHDPNLLAKWCATVFSPFVLYLKKSLIQVCLQDILFALVITLEGCPSNAGRFNQFTDRDVIDRLLGKQRKKSVG